MFKCWRLCSFLSLLLLPFFSGLDKAGADIHPTAGLSSKWIANYQDRATGLSPILVNGHNGSDTAFACAFYLDEHREIYYFGILIAGADKSFDRLSDLIPVWSANRDNPVSTNATLELTAEGDLVLTDVDGSVAWSANTTGKSVAGMNLTDTGNLVVFDNNNAAVWQSFDHPTDSLVLGQKLKVGQKLTPSNSQMNRKKLRLFSLALAPSGLSAQTETDPPQVYHSVPIDFPDTSNDSNYIEFVEGALALFVNSSRQGSVLSHFDSRMRYMKFGSNGNLASYQWDGSNWNMRDDLLSPGYGNCSYPTICGKYGICYPDGQCRCPTSSKGTRYFKPVDDRNFKLGCVETVPLSCEASQFQTFLELNDISYFTDSPDMQIIPDLANTDKESCKQACARDCSCTTAFFQNDSGSCYLVSQVFSLIYDEETLSYSTVLIKVQNVSRQVPSPSPSKKSNDLVVIILCSSAGSLFVLIILFVFISFLVHRRQVVDEVEDDSLERLPGLSTRFTYDELRVVTDDFSKKLGQGGFGSVFEGTLMDGTKIAVKRLDEVCQIKKSFLAEVETIGSIHHVNLVRLIGLCATKFHRLLVYEYMSNGSLDQWIFCKSKGSFMLDWKKRRKIIYDIVKGLNYLHEECRWKIVHMDIKPQNILLDGNFTAKVADFGLSKLLDRDQSQAETTMRGTPGYMAPEWLSTTITEKVDVYSFGAVVLEIICGRKVFDSSQNEEDMYLLDVFKRKAEEGRLLDMVDNTCEDLQLNRPQVVNMMRIAAWCLQGDFSKRPSMSTVNKVLDGVKEIPDDLGYDFSRPTLNVNVRIGHENIDLGAIISVLPSILSGPR